jgi:PAS domain S-box-containing protein
MNFVFKPPHLPKLVCIIVKFFFFLQTFMNLIPSFLKSSTIFPVTVLNSMGNYVYANECFLNTYGINKNTYPGKPFSNSVYYKDIDACVAAAKYCMDNLGSPKKVLIRKPLNGNFDDLITTLWEFTAVSNNNEDVLLICIGYDTTALEMQKIKLESINNVLKALYENVNEGLILVANNQKITFFNKSARLIAEKRNQINPEIGLDFLKIIPDTYIEETEAYIKQVLQGKKVVVDKEFDNTWWRATFVPIFENDQSIMGFTFSIVNIEDIKKNELRITAQTKRLKEIAWKQSHEVRGPLSNILGITRIIAQSEDGVNELEGIDYVKLLESSATELDNIISKIVFDIYEENNPS